MNRLLYTGFVACGHLLTLSALMLMSGCWGLPFKGGIPDDYSEIKESIETLYGATEDQITSSFGPPTWTVRRKRSTYYIYQSLGKDRAWLWVGYLPTFVFGTTEAHWYCILLQFNEQGVLSSHKFAVEDETTGLYPQLSRTKCLDTFYSTTMSSATSAMLRHEIGSYCPNADLGHADAQKHIGDIYYFAPYLLDKDLVSAYVWYTLSARGGDEDAMKLLGEVISELTAAEMVEAEQHLEHWAPGQCKSQLEEVLSEAIPEGSE
jgi:hypothetical protein